MFNAMLKYLSGLSGYSIINHPLHENNGFVFLGSYNVLTGFDSRPGQNMNLIAIGQLICLQNKRTWQTFANNCIFFTQTPPQSPEIFIQISDRCQLQNMCHSCFPKTYKFLRSNHSASFLHSITPGRRAWMYLGGGGWQTESAGLIKDLKQAGERNHATHTQKSERPVELVVALEYQKKKCAYIILQ